MTKLNRISLSALALAVVWVPLSASASSAHAAGAETDPISVVKHLYAAYRADDNKTAMGLIAPDATWSWYGPKYIIPFAGTYHGPEGVTQFFRDLHAVLKDGNFGQREYIADGETVAVPGWDEGTIRATGGHFKVNNLHMFKIRGGKIVSFEEYIDTADIIEAFEPANSVRGLELLEKCGLAKDVARKGRAAISGLIGSDADDLTRQIRVLRTATPPGSDPLHVCAADLPGDRGVRDIAAYVASLPHDK